MFDPTVYENLKVVLEGAVYDLDLAGSIRVTSREDWVNLAVMARKYRIDFRLSEASDRTDTREGDAVKAAAVSAEVVLSTELSDLAAEILEMESSKPGCSLDVSFLMRLPAGLPADETERVCREIEASLKQVWGERFGILQTLSYDFGDKSGTVLNRVRLLFGRRFGEEVAEDFPRIIDHTVLSLQELARVPNR